MSNEVPQEIIKTLDGLNYEFRIKPDAKLNSGKKDTDFRLNEYNKPITTIWSGGYEYQLRRDEERKGRPTDTSRTRGRSGTRDTSRTRNGSCTRGRSKSRSGTNSSVEVPIKVDNDGNIISFKKRLYIEIPGCLTNDSNNTDYCIEFEGAWYGILPPQFKFDKKVTP